MMKIAIVGTGRMGKAIAKTLAQAYPGSVSFAGRDLNQTKKVASELGRELEVCTSQEALHADVIIPTFWYKDLFGWLLENSNDLKGKILIDITNPFNDKFDDFVTPYDTSSAEEIQKVIPSTKVVGAFKNTFWVVFETPVLQGITSDIYVTSDHNEARQQVISLLKPLPFRVLDAGMLKNNRTIERMTLLSRELAMKAGSHPRNSFNLWGLEHDGLNTIG